MDEHGPKRNMAFPSEFRTSKMGIKSSSKPHDDTSTPIESSSEIFHFGRKTFLALKTTGGE